MTCETENASPGRGNLNEVLVLLLAVARKHGGQRTNDVESE